MTVFCTKAQIGTECLIILKWCFLLSSYSYSLFYRSNKAMNQRNTSFHWFGNLWIDNQVKVTVIAYEIVFGQISIMSYKAHSYFAI